ncbi:MAG: chromosomal replication initiator protein DnaA [Chloroflexi bacterium]|nr:chromosomal replication initiator protein DnaA [Chloroflexota bacterium]
MSPNEIWQQALTQLRQQLPAATFDTWLRATEGLALQNELLVVGVPNAFVQDWIEQRLNGRVEATLQQVAGTALACTFVVAGPTTAEPARAQARAEPRFEQPRLPEPSASSPPSAEPKLNPRYTFDSFVAGSGSRLAHAAAQAVAEHPADRYNPLFIYGGVGLGKTHLLHAIGHAAIQRGLHVIMVSSETFTNALINAIRGHSTEAFRTVYRAADVLLVDDIQFIAGKESTQEEFFHTFNTVHGAEGQIVMTSDRPPQAIATLEDRLRSRFQWGLLVDIEPPDLETRIAILRDKNARHARSVPDGVLALIAGAVQQNVRELEGALNRVVAYADCNHLPLNSETAQQALSDLMIRREAPGLPQILRIVGNFYGIEEDVLKGRKRTAQIAEPRQVAMYLMREEADASFPAIGAAIGGRDHTTVLHGCEKIARLIEQDAKLRRDVMQIRERMYA